MAQFDPFAKKVNRQLLPFEEAFDLALGSARLLDSESVDIFDASGRVLAQDIYADTDYPPFDRAVVDGYACRRQDLDRVLVVVEEIPAGAVPKRKIGIGECARIMTGAPIPEGADIVVMVEETVPVAEDKIKFVGKNPETNIYRRGSDVSAGQLLIPRGTRLFPQHIAVLASVGMKEVKVYQKPRVGILVTGDEIVEPEHTPSIGQIRNTNAYTLWAQLMNVGATTEYYGVVPDNLEDIERVLKGAVEKNHVVLVCGGVSMGEYDFVPDILRRLGFEIKFDRVAIKPGRPTTFAVSENRVVFGLPGNPVSSFVAFEILVKPFLFAMMGHSYEPVRVVAPLGVDVERKVARRDERIPVRLSQNGEVIPIEYHGSAHFQALIDADGLIMIPRGVKRIPRGQKVDVWLIRWN